MDDGMAPLIEVRDVSKTFVVRARAGRVRRERRVVRAVDGVSFTVEQGAMVGYIGPNRAGKSTTIKIYRRISLAQQAVSEWPKGREFMRPCE